MVIATAQKLTLQAFLDYDDGTDFRYELENGVLVEMGTESTLNGRIASFLFAVFFQLGVTTDRISFKQYIEVYSAFVTARDPDLTIHSEESAAALDGLSQACLRREMPAPTLVIEVVSRSDRDKRSRDRDYITKRSEYAERGIPEYWIIDPIAQVFILCRLNGKTYDSLEFRGDEAIVSPSFPNLNLTASQVLEARR